ncbi:MULTISPECIES: hypothetical protein [Bradyrhizobium]|uniref:Uncharacterized protein n=1 Tax=Bradyrhizobium zhengyangense TaxID=2911009 RepID=A0A9X1UB74_9BRAD|nr:MULTISPECIES: hypothetical protein [Bradyrhizobium]MCG2631920.1 hypothetical protein [Bradyrhizobium zhengyangense]MCG2644975.1 hypothetical protein [Bradyrhizobium zhengyangense]MCG2672715.1 hypothetical protein [Bradyrhizobium zhengyangense]MDN4985438.1 hypothetical protein [Bradyrhizobium sp. WYCCWR 13022]MDN5002330.1 hypothetical protein [Bradyrhizobium sp. WYCCWR 12677]
MIDELFGTESFRGALSALRADASALVDERLATLPAFEEPDTRVLPAVLVTGTTALQRIVDRTVRALAFAEWRGANAAALKSFLQPFGAARTVPPTRAGRSAADCHRCSRSLRASRRLIPRSNMFAG